jgi:hypothetical protein
MRPRNQRLRLAAPQPAFYRMVIPLGLHEPLRLYIGQEQSRRHSV